MSNERMALNDESMELVVGGTLLFAENMGQMRYRNGNMYYYYKLEKSADAGYRRSLALHAESDDEDWIVSVLQKEGYIGKMISSRPVD